jgi:hypothetical protein
VSQHLSAGVAKRRTTNNPSNGEGMVVNDTSQATGNRFHRPDTEAKAGFIRCPNPALKAIWVEAAEKLEEKTRRV